MLGAVRSNHLRLNLAVYMFIHGTGSSVSELLYRSASCGIVHYEYLDCAALLAGCPEGIGLYESSNPYSTCLLCDLLTFFTHRVVNVKCFSCPEEAE